jgi:glycosyltransferase involved in cell wall biosynthesis
MCGIPIVAFKTGGLVDIVDHKINGYLADAKNIEDFSSGIAWILNEKDYNLMQEFMIYGTSLSFVKLLESIEKIQNRINHMVF